MKGRVIHIDEAFYIVRCDALALPVVVHKIDIVPLAMVKNLDECLGNSNGERWSDGLHLDFDVHEIDGMTVGKNISVCLPNTGE